MKGLWASADRSQLCDGVDGLETHLYRGVEELVPRCNYWNLMLDQNGNPNIDPFRCGGLVTLKADGSIAEGGKTATVFVPEDSVATLVS